jgi:hypothetical protein
MFKKMQENDKAHATSTGKAECDNPVLTQCAKLRKIILCKFDLSDLHDRK